MGLLAASLSVWNAERAAGGAEWSPFVQQFTEPFYQRVLMLDKFSALASRVDSAINPIERPRDVGVQLSSPPRASRGSATTVKRRGCRPAAPAGSWSGSAPAGAVVGPGRPGAGVGAQLGAGLLRPRGFTKARMGERLRIDPEQVGRAQPGGAWVIQAGQSLHLRVLPRRL